MQADDSSDTKENLMQGVIEARELQMGFLNEKIQTNVQMTSRLIKKCCCLDIEAGQTLKKAMQTMHFSERSFTKILKVARTIADINKSDVVMQSHIKEAISYRQIEN